MAKEKSFEEYMKDWRKKQPIKLRADGTPMDDEGATSGEIRTSALDPLERKGKKRERVHTRIRRTKKPITSTTKVRAARKRRKDAVVEI